MHCPDKGSDYLVNPCGILAGSKHVFLLVVQLIYYINLLLCTLLLKQIYSFIQTHIHKSTDDFKQKFVQLFLCGRLIIDF